MLYEQGLRQAFGRIRREAHALGTRELEHRGGTKAAIQVDVQFRLGPAPQRVLGKTGWTLAGAHHHAKDRSALAHGIAGVHRPPHPVGHVRRPASHQLRERVVERFHGVAHLRPARHRHRALVHEDADHRSHPLASAGTVSVRDTAITA